MTHTQSGIISLADECPHKSTEHALLCTKERKNAAITNHTVTITTITTITTIATVTAFAAVCRVASVTAIGVSVTTNINAAVAATTTVFTYRIDTDTAAAPFTPNKSA